jgi:hypothetical protein
MEMNTVYYCDHTHWYAAVEINELKLWQAEENC